MRLYYWIVVHLHLWFGLGREAMRIEAEHRRALRTAREARIRHLRQAHEEALRWEENGGEEPECPPPIQQPLDPFSNALGLQAQQQHTNPYWDLCEQNSRLQAEAIWHKATMEMDRDRLNASVAGGVAGAFLGTKWWR